MSDNKIPLSRPSLGEEEIREVFDVIQSGWITSGPRVKRFEEEFGRYVGARHAVAVNSCTAALHVALLAHRIGPGDEVVTSTMTWSATVNMIEVLGAKPVFADIDRDTLQITPEAVAAALTDRTRAILPVHFAGQACDLNGFAAIAAPRGIVMIQDAAHAVGTEFRGSRIGGEGGTACFSFHPIKNITTGEGGMITTDSDDLAEKLRLLRFHGVNRDAWSRYGKVDTPRYETVTPGWKYNLTDLQAALGIHQLAKLDGFIKRRTRLAELYHAQLAGIDGVNPPRASDGNKPPRLASLCRHYRTRLVRMRPRSVYTIDDAARCRHGTSLYRCAPTRLLPCTVRLRSWGSAQYGMGLGPCRFSTVISRNERLRCVARL